MDSQENRSSSDATNAFTESEFAKALARVQHLTPEVGSQASLNDTDPFTPGELERRHGAESTLLDNDAPEADDRSQRANVRLLLHPATSKPLVVQVSSRGNPDPVSLQPFILDASAGLGGTAINRLAVAQSGRDIGFRVEADFASGSPFNPRMLTLGHALNLMLYCDPSDDSLVVNNQQMNPITAKRLAPDRVEELEAVAVELQPCIPTFLDAGSWAIYATATAEEHHIMDLSILPRQHVAINTVGTYMENRQSLKRAFEASQPITSLKKGKAGACSADSKGAIAFQTVPREIGAITIHGATETPSVAHRSGHHPLEQLKPGATVKIIGHQGDYTLTCVENIMLQKNSLVLKAEHSLMPSVTVVKVLRTPSQSSKSAMPDRGASKVANTAEMWLKEFKNHSKLSQHAAVVRLYDADARLLALYMEHVEAPDLASYRQRDGTCTLVIDDAKRILADMSAAIAYVHGKGIVHNDIKPANILFERTRGAVLIDFGMSSDLKETTAHAGGSPWYIPPEYVIRGTRGPPGDVFALGVVLLFVLRKIPLPELHRDNWQIADVRKVEGKNTARDAMNQWLEIVDAASLEAFEDGPLGALVSEMLVNVTHRIKVGDLLRQQSLGD